MPTFKLEKGQKLTRLIENTQVEITITRLGTRDVEFLANGSIVKNPEKTRTLPIATFVKWVRSLDATKQSL